MKNLLSRKLRIYSILMRIRELEIERIENINNRRIRQFHNPPITLTRMPPLEPLVSLYDKKGKPFDPPKSKFHK
jgi:hypothetical protein